MTTTDPTPLAEQIASEHGIADDLCNSGFECKRKRGMLTTAHIATVAELAVRHCIAAEIEAANKAEVERNPRVPPTFLGGLRAAARIARGATDD